MTLTTIPVDVIKVFTTEIGKFGNPLGIVKHDVLPEPVAQQKLANHLGYSETIFIHMPQGNSGIAVAKIYTPTCELPFAGHPTIGLSWWLAHQGYPIHTLSVPAGDLPVSYIDDRTSIVTDPSFSPAFHFQQYATAAEVLQFDPKHYTHPDNLYIWSYLDKNCSTLRTRMFVPELGMAEDEATGSAATTLTALLQQNLHIIQGQGSEIFTEFFDEHAVKLSGRAVFSTSYEVDLDLL